MSHCSLLQYKLVLTLHARVIFTGLSWHSSGITSPSGRGIYLSCCEDCSFMLIVSGVLEGCQLTSLASPPTTSHNFLYILQSTGCTMVLSQALIPTCKTIFWRLITVNDKRLSTTHASSPVAQKLCFWPLSVFICWYCTLSKYLSGINTVGAWLVLPLQVTLKGLIKPGSWSRHTTNLFPLITLQGKRREILPLGSERFMAGQVE